MRTFHFLIAAIQVACISTSCVAQDSIPKGSGLDDADYAAITYFKSIAWDGNEHLIVWNGEIHDVSSASSVKKVACDYEKLATIVAEGKPLIFFHSHPAGIQYHKIPSQADFAVATSNYYFVWRINIRLKLESRVLIRLQDKALMVSYGNTGGVMGPTLNNASYGNIVANELDILGAESTRKSELLQLERDLNSFQYNRLNAVEVNSSYRYLYRICPKPLYKIEGYRVCPSKDYFIRIRGVVPN